MQARFVQGDLTATALDDATADTAARQAMPVMPRLRRMLAVAERS